jgi:Ca2+-binding EF-hand superfamily protein
MQVSAASSTAQELMVSVAKAAGRSERIVSKDAFGTTRQTDRFEKTLASQNAQPTYSLESARKAEPSKLTSGAIAATRPADLSTMNGPNGDSVQFTQTDLDNLSKLLGASKGDSQYQEQFDLDGNGTINLQDLNAMLAQISEGQQAASVDGPTFTQDDLDLLLEAFGAQTGDENYSEALDLDGDGLIGLQDLNTMLGSLSQQPEQQGYSQTHIDQLTAAFGASTGDENFVASLDLNEDGTLNMADLNAMLASMNG